MSNSHIGPSASKTPSLQSKHSYNYRSGMLKKPFASLNFGMQALRLIGGTISTLILGPIAAVGMCLWCVGKTWISMCKYLVERNIENFSIMKKNFQEMSRWMPLIIPGLAAVGFLLDSYQRIIKFNNKEIT
ncbi:hypothetical protein CLAVI_000794 [Candidatus Clavichlamydia salmonicola]|uniref:hypothetical protein n=1 Tax=Candidatus Clavichlamydia salmonicola TaxID=469812 RepID=UPI001890BF6D|nr:hypothetical protein [Candidatus Clavichlamydia salmonicola]MBF5051158.1 hypothetical protein [Candidatus Clavichlamydia salmonicola]